MSEPSTPEPSTPVRSTPEPLAASGRQPWVHELVITVDGNVTALSGQDADIRPGTAEGLYIDDTRVLDLLRVQVGGESVSPISCAASGSRAEFLGAARGLGDRGADPTVQVTRTRTLGASGLREDITVTSRASSAVTAELRVELGTDAATISAVKSGAAGTAPVRPALDGDVLVFDLPRHRVRVDFAPAGDVDLLDGTLMASHTVVVAPGESATFTVVVSAPRTVASDFDADAGSGAVDWDGVRVTADDPRLAPLVAQSMADLRHLLLRDPLAPADVFAAAGTPWYLTLFGRDSLWAARLMLPFGTELAAGTLRTLARRQGTVEAPDRAEQPGKILHELRPTAHGSTDGHLALPSLYYGTVDATALWVALLVDAWRWGMPEEQVRELVPALQAALGWISGPGQPDAHGFLTYLDTTGAGLANQGWKDSEDSMRFRDGTIAEAPISLVEAQAYAVEALLGGADLLDALGVEGAAAAREEAVALRERIGRAFWVEDAAGRYLAMALDRDGRPVDGVGSNMGHALGTGALTPDEAAQVAGRLTGPELLDPFGIRTFGREQGGFNPIGYHTGSIWTHDTAIAGLGLLREGRDAEASAVARALAASGAAFGNRWPELYSGLPMMGGPAPYPASCRPQAWSAASAGVLVSIALGLRADLPAGVLEVRPARPAPFGAIRVDGVRLGPHRLTVEVNRDGEVRVEGVPDGVRVRGTA